MSFPLNQPAQHYRSDTSHKVFNTPHQPPRTPAPRLTLRQPATLPPRRTRRHWVPNRHRPAIPHHQQPPRPDRRTQTGLVDAPREPGRGSRTAQRLRPWPVPSLGRRRRRRLRYPPRGTDHRSSYRTGGRRSLCSLRRSVGKPLRRRDRHRKRDAVSTSTTSFRSKRRGTRAPTAGTPRPGNSSPTTWDSNTPS